jgi:hypothetical protein
MSCEDGTEGHEGYLVGLVPEVGKTIDGLEYESDNLRELTYHRDGERQDDVPLRWVCVGCECGWRSPRLHAPSGTHWAPCHVRLACDRDDSISEGYEESARKIWAAHVADVRTHGMPLLRVDEDGMRAAWDRAVARRAQERQR